MHVVSFIVLQLRLMQVTRLGRHTALTFGIRQGATLSVCWTDKLAVDEQTQRTGMVIQPGLMERKERKPERWQLKPS